MWSFYFFYGVCSSNFRSPCMQREEQTQINLASWASSAESRSVCDAACPVCWCLQHRRMQLCLNMYFYVLKDLGYAIPMVNFCPLFSGMTEGTLPCCVPRAQGKKKPEICPCGVFRLFIVAVAAICYKRKKGCTLEMCSFLHSSDTAQKEDNILSSVWSSDFRRNTLCVLSYFRNSFFHFPMTFASKKTYMQYK